MGPAARGRGADATGSPRLGPLIHSELLMMDANPSVRVGPEAVNPAINDRRCVREASVNRLYWTASPVRTVERP